MKKFYGALAYACGSIAIATLVLGTMVGGGQQARAVEEGDDDFISIACSRIGLTSACECVVWLSVHNNCHLTVDPSFKCCH